jgi:hypothetical protein
MAKQHRNNGISSGISVMWRNGNISMAKRKLKLKKRKYQYQYQAMKKAMAKA